MEPITLQTIDGVLQNGPTDPINYYRRPVVGALFRKRINLGLGLLPARQFDRALEVGYGSGGVLLSLGKGALEVHGIDLDAEPESVRRMLATRGCHATLVQGTVHALPYPAGHFDLIVSFSVFEHLKHFVGALQEVHRVLAPDGLFLLGMPAVNRTMGVFFRAIGHSTIDDIHVTTPREISGSFESTGFQVAARAPLDVPFAPPFGLRLYHNWLLQKRPS